MADLVQLEALSVDELRAELAARKARYGTELEGPPGSLEGFDEDATSRVLGEKQQVTYGIDDRVGVFTLTDPAEIADATSVVALFRANGPTDNRHITSTLVTQSFGGPGGRSVNEPLRGQAIRTFCSGFVVDDDLIATAGHCMNASNMTSVWFVVGSRMQNLTTAQTVIADDQILRGIDLTGRVAVGKAADWEPVRVDQPVTGYPAVQTRSARPRWQRPARSRHRPPPEWFGRLTGGTE